MVGHVNKIEPMKRDDRSFDRHYTD